MWAESDIELVTEEVAKLISILRTTDRYSDVTKPALMWPRETVLREAPPTLLSADDSSAKASPQGSAYSTPGETAVVPVTSANLVAQFVDVEKSLRRHQSSGDVCQVLAPFLQVVVDPTLSGLVTGSALMSLALFCETGSHALFMTNPACVQMIVDGVTRTRFTETDRDHDEIVLIRIVSLVEFLLTKSSSAVIDKSRIAVGLQCIQTIWIQDSHSAALKDASRRAVYHILLHVLTLEEGCDGYEATLMENVCLNIELLSKQPPMSFDADKLSFFVEVLASITRLPKPINLRAPLEMVTFQVMHALHHLLPPGPAASAIDNGATGVLSRNMSALPVVSFLLRLGNDLVRRALVVHSTSPLLIEGLMCSMYLRALCPVTESGVALVGFGECALDLMTSRKNVPAPNGYINLVQSAAITHQLSPHTQQIQSTLCEGLIQLLSGSGVISTMWETFDCVWHRPELASGLIDAIVNMALSNRVIALIPPPPPTDIPSEEPVKAAARERVLRALSSFYALATSPESIIDPEALVPSYVECLAMTALKETLSSLSVEGKQHALSEDQTPTQLLIRLSAQECGKQLRAKPKKGGDIVSQFLNEFQRSIKSPDPDHLASAKSIAWGLRMIPGIDFDSLGEFFGQPGEVSTQSLSEFIRSLNLKTMDPEEALRACLQSFRLPGEAQQIDRIVKEIAYEYYKAHADLTQGGNYFASADAAYTFLFSVIMLNTDQHNPQVKRRMELRDFIRNNRKINEGGDIPEDVQSRVFNSIRNSQIVTPKSSSYFCAPLKGRWKDLWYLNETGYIPNKIRHSGKHSIHRFLASKGYDMLVAASYVVARDPRRFTNALEVIASLAELCLSSTPHGADPVIKLIGADSVSVLRRYAVKSFATVISNITPTQRSFDALSALLRLNVIADSLIEAVSAMLCYWAPYELLLSSSECVLTLPNTWDEILCVPLIDVNAGSPQPSGGAISSLFRGLFYDQGHIQASAVMQDEDTTTVEGEPASSKSETGASTVSVRKSSSLLSSDLAGSGDWRKEVIRTSFMDGSPNAPVVSQLGALKGVEVEKYLTTLLTTDEPKSSAIVLMMFEQIAATTKPVGDFFWSKELIRSSPWALLLAARLLARSKQSDLIASSTARDAIVSVIRNYVSGQLNDARGLKVAVFTAFGLVTLFAQKDPDSNIVDPAWILPILDEVSGLAQEVSATASIAPAICLSIQMMVAESPATWLSKVGAPVWRECIRLTSVLCPKNKSSQDAEIGRKICFETAVRLLTDPNVLEAFCVAANGANDMADCVLAIEQILTLRQAAGGVKSVSKSMGDLACKLAGTPNGGIAWTAIVGRVTARISAVAKQKKPTGVELSDSVELLRICLGDPRAHQILNPLQAGATVEKSASALSAVVSANTPPGALEAALCVFARFFLSCLESLQQHPQFDHLWLMSLRVVLLFIKRGHDDPSMEQLAEITTETLRNALQVLVATNLLQLPPVQNGSAEDAPIVWWKVTWEIVETFCPGMWTELRVGDDEAEPETPQEPEEAQDLSSRSSDQVSSPMSSPGPVIGAEESNVI